MNDRNNDRQARDALDDIDEAVARITDDDIEGRLRETLRRAGCTPSQHACADRLAEADPMWLLL